MKSKIKKLSIERNFLSNGYESAVNLKELKYISDLLWNLIQHKHKKK